MKKRDQILKRLLLGGLTIFAAITVTAQNTDFTGNWALDSITLYHGDINNPILVPKQIKIDQQKDRIILIKKSAGTNGEDVITSETLGFDGNVFQTTNHYTNGKKTVFFSRGPTGNSFNTTTQIYNPIDSTHLEYSQLDIWSINDEKLILKRKAKILNKDAEYEIDVIYQKKN